MIKCVFIMTEEDILGYSLIKWRLSALQNTHMSDAAHLLVALDFRSQIIQSLSRSAKYNY